MEEDTERKGTYVETSPVLLAAVETGLGLAAGSIRKLGVVRFWSHGEGDHEEEKDAGEEFHIGRVMLNLRW